MPSDQPTAAERERAVRLYDHFFPKLSRWLKRRCGDASDALDMTHETIAYGSRQELPVDDRYAENRLFWIARRLLIDRSRRKRPITSDLSSSEPIDGRTERLEEGRQELLESVRSAIDSLPKNESECIRLMYYEGLGTTQIARRLGLSASVVKELLARAHARLHGLLKDDVSDMVGEGGRA